MTKPFVLDGPARPLRPSRGCWCILLVLLIPWTLLIFLAVDANSSHGPDRRAIVAPLAALTGPFAGAVTRGGQDCCLKTSLQIAAITHPFLIVGILAQFVPMPFQRGGMVLRLLLWTAGWAAWFFGGFVSMLHALS
jgi:hypothetical protein